MPKKVIFSNRAFTALLVETKEKMSTETGGIFIGVMDGDSWYVVEAIDPGPKSIFQPGYFEYDGNYVRHLANKVNRLYGDKLDVLGLWHRHPGSMSTFSSTDDGTNKLFAEQNNGITISALVNVDPKFRLTVYMVTLNPLEYEKIDYEVDDAKIPEAMKNVLCHMDVENQINSIAEDMMFPSNKRIASRNNGNFCDIISAHLKKTESYSITDDDSIGNSAEDYDFLIENLIVDECLFCDEISIPYTCDCKDGNEIDFIIGEEDSDCRFSFYLIDFSCKDNYVPRKQLIERVLPFLFPASEIEKIEGKHPCFIYKGALYLYKGNLFKNVWEEYAK